jgi:hypothetical protein
MFMAKALILGESSDELEKYLDVAAFARGDLYYIQKLVSILDTYGFSLEVSPSFRSAGAGSTASYTIQIQHSDSFASTVTLQAGPSPSPDLLIDLNPPTSFGPPGGQTILTLIDLHDASFPHTLWYVVPVTASGGGIVRTVNVRMLVNGPRVFLPIVAR